MRVVTKVGANAACPCGKLNRKYKNCCRGRVDWETLSFSAGVRHLSLRGKNLLFLNLMLDALQIDKQRGPADLPDFKRAFTSDAVKKIHEAVAAVWPDGSDLDRVMREETESTSGLYIGFYEPDRVQRGVTRHSLYSDRILLIDPLVYPGRMRGELDPLSHPHLHRSTTVRWATIWFQMAPWIEQGIVAFIRPLSDFNFTVLRESFDLTKKRFERHPELAKLFEDEAQNQRGTSEYKRFTEHIMLSMPESQVRKLVKEFDPNATEEQIQSVLERLEVDREFHPYYVDKENPTALSHEILQISSGVNYEQGKQIATRTNSYLMTDIRARWREIELDRQESGISSEEWSPFAKAFDGLSFNFLDAVPLNAALTLRQEGRLESLRLFLRKVWAAAHQDSPFDHANVSALAAELDEKVREAEVEWRTIDRDLIRLVAAEASAGLLAAGPLVAAGQAAFLGAALAVAGVLNLTASTMKRKEYKLQYPASFFVDLQKGRYS